LIQSFGAASEKIGFALNANVWPLLLAIRFPDSITHPLDQWLYVPPRELVWRRLVWKNKIYGAGTPLLPCRRPLGKATFYQFAGIRIDIGEAAGFAPFKHFAGKVTHLFKRHHFSAQWQPAPNTELVTLRALERARFPINLLSPGFARSHRAKCRR
jgi:hypothetical protein